MTPLPAGKSLETFFLEARSKILDVAAILDRIGRGQDSAVAGDPRLQRIAKALEVLQGPSGGRAEGIQKVFSLDYEAEWKKPVPRY